MSMSLLPAKPKRGKGVRRLNRMPVWIGAGAVVVVLLVIAYTYQQRANRVAAETAEADANQTQGAASHAKDVVTVVTRPSPLPPAPAGATPLQPIHDVQQVPNAAATNPAEDARAKAWAAHDALQAQIDQAKADALAKALTSDTDATSTGQGNGAGIQAVVGGPGAGSSAPNGLPSAGIDAGAQAEKRAFLGQTGDPLGLNEDLQAALHPMKTDTVMEGTAIPGFMVGGLNSDMPGMVVGQVAQNVYDSATGNDLLIPQGSRVVGQYDNSVSNGQSRIGVVWQRIIFPDTSSIQLGSMEGADQGGYAGFHDLIDTHFWEKFAAATLISIGGAAAQLAQPQQSAFSGYSPSSVAAGSLTQQYSQLGQEYARAGLSIPNTIEVRPGYAFVIMVAKDMHLPVYVDHRTGSTSAALRGAVYQ